MGEMIVIVCSICGEPASADAARCPECEAIDQRAIPEKKMAPTREERLLSGVERTIESLDDLRIAHAREQVQKATAQKERALRMRLQAQGSVLEARLRSQCGHGAQAREQKALQRIRHELYRPSL